MLTSCPPSRSLSPYPHPPSLSCTEPYSLNLSPSCFDDNYWTSRHELSHRSRVWTRHPDCAACWCVLLSFSSLSFRPEVLMIMTKGWEEAIQHCQSARHSLLSHKLRPWMRPLLPLAVVSQAEYFVLLLRCAAEATSNTPSAMSVISQHKQDKVRVRRRHRFVRISSRLQKHHWLDRYKINYG
jgi:hypothetical protein